MSDGRSINGKTLVAYILTTLLAVGIFVVDISLPPHYVIHVLLLAPILVTILQRSPKWTLTVTAICAILKVTEIALYIHFPAPEALRASINIAVEVCVGVLVARAIQSMLAEEFARRRAEALAEISDCVRSARTVEEVYDKAINLIAGLITVDRVFIMPVGVRYEGLSIRIDHEWHRPDVKSLIGATLPPPDPASMRNLKWQGRVNVITDARREAGVTPSVRDEFGIIGALGARLYVAGESVGILGLHDCHGPRRWTQAETALVESIADHISIAGDEALLNRQVNEQNATIDFVFEHAPIGIAIVESDDTVARFNRFLSMVFHVQPEDVIGSPIQNVHADIADTYFRFRDVVFAGQTVLNRSIRLQIPDSPDAISDLRISLFPISGIGEGVRQIGVLIEDTTNEDRIQRETVLSLARERRINATLQRSLLPALPPNLSSISTGLTYRPAAASRGIGGDFLDVVPLEDGRIAMFIGDVSGHGIEAAAETSLIKNVLRAYTLLGDSPSATVARLNTALVHQFQFDSLVTLFFGILTPETGRLVYASAGHEPPMVVRDNGTSIESLMPTGTVIGLSSDSRFSEGQCILGADDVLVLITDGFVEARTSSKRELLGEKRLHECLLSCIHSPKGLQASADAVWDCVVANVGGSDLEDDAAMLLIALPPLKGSKGGRTTEHHRDPVYRLSPHEP